MAPVLKQAIGQTADDVQNTPDQTQHGNSATRLVAHLDGTDVRTHHDDATSQSCSRA